MKIENVAVISLEDYAEYQELKKRKSEIDYNRLRTGSEVIIDKELLTSRSRRNYAEGMTCHVVLLDSNYQIYKYGLFDTCDDNKYTTLLCDGEFIHAISDCPSYIKEVIKY